MLTEECHLNENLERRGIEVIETDLGERILQMMKLAPSHIVMPALHVHREDIGATFRRLIPNYKEIAASYSGRVAGDSVADENDPTFLTYVARMHLRQQFMEADAGMTGANFGVAETGDVVVCTNEGNADMSTSIPKLHIVSMGIEKLMPNYAAMGVFQRLLARNGTGQETTVYTSHFRGPRPGGEMHIVLVDNGRSSILSNQEHWQTLKCMRCGACMNTCPVYRRSAGYSYTYFIPGPIGINLGMLRDARRYSDNVSACSLCCSCDNVCPAKVDLSTQIYRWRQQLDSLGKADPMKKYMSVGMGFLFNNPQVYTCALRLSPMVNWVPGPLLQSSLNPWAYAHQMMKFPQKSFHQLWKEKKL
jgi:L-lactate dehydrogenase complex protein LldF